MKALTEHQKLFLERFPTAHELFINPTTDELEGVFVKTDEGKEVLILYVFWLRVWAQIRTFENRADFSPPHT